MSDVVFRALADPQRRKILKLLRGGSMSAGEIVASFDLTPGTLSHHFSVLKGAGLVLCERQSQRIVYSLNTAVVEQVTAMVLELFQKPPRRGKRA